MFLIYFNQINAGLVSIWLLSLKKAILNAITKRLKQFEQLHVFEFHNKRSLCLYSQFDQKQPINYELSQ